MHKSQWKPSNSRNVINSKQTFHKSYILLSQHTCHNKYQAYVSQMETI